MMTVRTAGTVLAITLLLLVPAALWSQNQYFYLVADSGGGPPGNDLLTLIDVLNPGSETPIGSGVGTFTMEGAARYPGAGFSSQTLYGTTADRLYIVNRVTGVGSALPSSYGSGPGPLGVIAFDDVDGAAFDNTTDPPIMYANVRRESGGNPADLLIRLNYATGAHVAAAWGSGTDYLVIEDQGPSLNDIDDIAIRSDGVMYAINNNSGSEDRLVILDPATGGTTDVGRLRRSDDSEDVDDMEGLDFDCNGTLWGVTGQNSSESDQRNRIWMFQTDIGGDPTRYVTEIDHMTHGSDYESIVGCVEISISPTPSPSPEVPTPSVTPTAVPSPTPGLSGICLRTGHSTLSIGATSATSFVNTGLELSLWTPDTTAVAVFSSYDCDTGFSTEPQTGYWDLRMDNTWSSQTLGRYLSGIEDLGLGGVVHIFENVAPGTHTFRLRQKTDGSVEPQIATRNADMVAFALTVEDGSAEFNYGTGVLDAVGDTTSSTSFEDVDGLACTVTLDIPGKILVSCALNGESTGGSGDRVCFWRLQVDGTTVGVDQEHRKLSGTNDLGSILLQGLTENLCAGTYTVTVQHMTNDAAKPLRTMNATLIAVGLSTADAGGLELPAALTASSTFNDTTSTSLVDAAT
ncbi:MAG TPA: hypothetical protein PLI51_05925, partial [bacterium]|nr:hypothetical protein [bacterium]